MKAALLINTGNIDEIRNNLVIKNIPEPEIGEDEILIKLNYASLNHRDIWISEGMYPKIKLPVILGSDGAGVVYALGINAEGFKEGDEVIINPGFDWGVNEDFQSREFNILGLPSDGTFAEYVKVKKDYVHKKPESLNLEQASSLPLAGITAYRALFKKAKIKSGENILITGIGGGVSMLAMMFALKAGVNVYVTSGCNDKINFAINLGAKAGVNYNDENWFDKISKLADGNINIILDSAGGNSFSKFIEIISSGGRIISYGSSFGNADNINLHMLYWKQIKIYGTAMGSRSDFMEMLEYVNEKNVVPVIDNIFPLEEICKCFLRMKTAEQTGKIVLKI